jgi:hypothetical protein
VVPRSAYPELGEKDVENSSGRHCARWALVVSCRASPHACRSASGAVRQTLEEVRRLAEADDRSVSSWIRRAVEHELEQQAG